MGPENACHLILLQFQSLCAILAFLAQVAHFLLSVFCTPLRTHASLQLEIAALRHQLSVYERGRTRPRIAPAARLLWAFLARWWGSWRRALWFVQPRTVTAWQQKRFRDYWRALSESGLVGRPKISPELRNLIKRMWKANPTWGSTRIVGELRTLGIHVAKSTGERYRPRYRAPPSSTWKTFLNQHVKDLVAIDFFFVPTVQCRVLFVFIALAHDRRRVLHFKVTEHPTAQRTAQQLVEAFPFDTAPRYLLRDGDGIYNGEKVQQRIESLSIDEVVTAPASPWQNAYVERVIGSIRREMLNHVIVLNECRLKRLLSRYKDYYHHWRTHRSLDMDAPHGRPFYSVESSNVIEFPAVHGLHHYYPPKAA